MNDKLATTVEVIPIDLLHQDPANARKHPARNLSDIKASLARFGQVTPIVVDAHNVVRKGNGTMLAARELRWKTLECVRTSLTGVDAAAYAVADNRSGLSSEWDEEVLARTLEAIRSEPDFPIEATGFTDDEVQSLLKKLGDDVLADQADDEGDSPAAGNEDEPKDWNPAIRVELVFDTVEQQDRWFGFVRFLKGRPEYDAATIAGRIDLFLVGGQFVA